MISADYGDSSIAFRLAGISRTTNAAWYRDESAAAELAMKRALRQGTYRDLNVYFLAIGGGVLGYCSYPVWKPTREERVLDGCSVQGQSVPGGALENFNHGRTLTHEAGHWFGLHHTFHGGCDRGDFVSDTPAEASPAWGCPVGRDTCTGEQYLGQDPIHNFMDCECARWWRDIAGRIADDVSRYVRHMYV